MHIIIFLSLLILSCWQFAVYFSKRQQAAQMAAMKLASIKHAHEHTHKHAHRMGEHHGR